MVWIASLVVAPGGWDVWKVAAVTALAVSVLHGLIFWVVRRRQRQVRTQAIHEIKEMLADVVKNQLAIIGMSLPERGETADDFHIESIKDSVAQIEGMMDAISEETLVGWKATYAEILENTGVTPPEHEYA